MQCSNTKKLPRLLLSLLLLGAPPVALAGSDPAAEFANCLERLRSQAASAGVPRATLDNAFLGIEYRPRIVELDRRQPELVQTFSHYFNKRVTEERIQRGRERLEEHRGLLNALHAEYGVRPEYLVALWGLETNYGSYIGRTPVLDALATLSCEGRRGEFFTEQFLHALRIIDEDGFSATDLRGSWAGAMGHTQFIPTTFTGYAVDHDGDGQRNVWQSLPDALASAANYLSRMGWEDGERWGREVRLPPDFEWSAVRDKRQKPLTEWQRLGVRSAGGEDLPAADINASLVLPSGHRGPVFLVYENFEHLLSWNASTHYALAVGHLADRIAGMGGLHASLDLDEQALSRDEIMEMQRLLKTLGYLEGAVDGIAGRKTRAAIRAFQHAAQLPADGHPSHLLLEQLRRG